MHTDLEVISKDCTQLSEVGVVILSSKLHDRFIALFLKRTKTVRNESLFLNIYYYIHIHTYIHIHIYACRKYACRIKLEKYKYEEKNHL